MLKQELPSAPAYRPCLRARLGIVQTDTFSSRQPGFLYKLNERLVVAEAVKLRLGSHP
jgi:hypothetical protein